MGHRRTSPTLYTGLKNGIELTANVEKVSLDPTRTIALQVAQLEETLPPTGRRIAAALQANYPAAGLDTVASLAREAGVSSPSVVRFIAQLGFNNFREFQEALRDELGGRDASALSQARAVSKRPHDRLDGHREHLAEGVHLTLSDENRAAFGRAVELLTAARAIVALGGDYSRAAADHAVAQLCPLRANVRPLPETALRVAAELADASAADCWLVLDFRRYESRTFRIAEAAQARGVKIVLITDRWRSPIEALSESTLVARVETAGASDTLVPAMALVEALSDAVEQKIGAAALERLEVIDPLRQRIGPR